MNQDKRVASPIPVKLYLRRVLNLLLWIVFCSMLGSGLLLKYRLLPGKAGGHGWLCLGLDRHEWGDVHFVLGIIFAVMVIAHLVMAWSWLKNAAAGKRLWPIALGLLSGAAICAVITLLPVDTSAGGSGQGKGLGRQLRLQDAD